MAENTCERTERAAADPTVAELNTRRKRSHRKTRNTHGGDGREGDSNAKRFRAHRR